MAEKRSSWPCNTCSITFPSSELQRSHMRQPWHVNNIRRRISDLPALTEEGYIAETSPADSSPRRKHSDEHLGLLHYASTATSERTGPSNREPKRTPSPGTSSSPPHIGTEHDKSDDGEDSEPYSPTTCLFCTHSSPTLAQNLSHMTTSHGLFIPHASTADLPSLLTHLATTISTHHTCLYCGVEKGSAASVQTHMRDKGHCMLKLDSGSELLSFWDFSGSEEEKEEEEGETEGEGDVDGGCEDAREGTSAGGKGVIRVSDTEMRLPSGTLIHSRTHSCSAQHRGQRPSRTTPQSRHAENQAAITAGGEGSAPPTSKSKDAEQQQSQNDRRVAVRGEMGLLGVSEQTRRALVATEKKMRRKEAVAGAARRHAMEMQPVKTIYYKTENPVYQAG